MRTEHTLPQPSFPLLHRDADEPLSKPEIPAAPPDSVRAKVRRVVCWGIAAILVIVSCAMAARTLLHLHRGAEHAPIRGR
jgi:hypothetical protein